jgi:hypothetical protein
MGLLGVARANTVVGVAKQGYYCQAGLRSNNFLLTHEARAISQMLAPGLAKAVLFSDEYPQYGRSLLADGL